MWFISVLYIPLSPSTKERRHRDHLQHELDMDVERRKLGDLELTIDTLTNDLERAITQADESQKRLISLLCLVTFFDVH